MKYQIKILHFFIRVCKFNFGVFEEEEFKKFLRMGLIFAVLIGVYWTLRPLKDSIFIQLVGKMNLPYAKTLSLFFLLPLVISYTRLLDKFAREKMLVILPAFYGASILCFGFAIGTIQAPENIKLTYLIASFISPKFLGYFWYVFVESFGSLIFALFWAFATDTTEPSSAKKGFPLIVALGQIGGVILPFGIGGLPYRLGLRTDILSIIILGILCLMVIPLVKYFLKITPRPLLRAFQGEGTKEKMDIQETSSFLGGLKILLKHRYLLGIFAVHFMYDFVVTLFDFNFKVAAGSAYSGVELSHYLSLYGSSINLLSLICLFLGISNVTRFLGVRVALASMPLIVSLALLGFLFLDSLPFLFALMAGSKAINYSLNGPTLKQLYIPTTTDARFKAQAWIEVFGSRTSKQGGSLFNMLLNPLQAAFGVMAGRSYYLALSGIFGFALIGVWFVIALYLGRNYQKAIDEHKTIC
jgi:AAA family ATP:ADP antiporter